MKACSGPALACERQHRRGGSSRDVEQDAMLEAAEMRARGVAPVELFQRLDRGHRFQPHQRRVSALVSGDDLAAEDALEEVGVAGFGSRRVLGDCRPFGCQSRELELIAQRGNAVRLQRRHATPQSARRRRPAGAAGSPPASPHAAALPLAPSALVPAA